MTDVLTIRVARRLWESMSLRDGDCNRLTFSLGAPDEDGCHVPTVTRHEDDNPLRAQSEQLEQVTRERDDLLDAAIEAAGIIACSRSVEAVSEAVNVLALAARTPERT